MKYGVTITFSEEAYVEVEANTPEEAMDIAAEMDDSEYEPLSSDIIGYEAEPLDEGKEK